MGQSPAYTYLVWGGAPFILLPVRTEKRGFVGFFIFKPFYLRIS